jgi:hypothetical protein
VHRFGLFITTAFLLMLPLVHAGGPRLPQEGKKVDDEEKKEGDKKEGDKKEGEKKQKEGGGKKELDKKKLLPPRPVSVVAGVEMKDGSSFLAEFRLADTVTIRTTNLGLVTLPVGTIHFLDVEGDTHRIVTHALETFYGFVQTEQLIVRMLANDRIVALTRTGLKRVGFPDPPREFPFP